LYTCYPTSKRRSLAIYGDARGVIGYDVKCS